MGQTDTPARLRLAELLAALSVVTDLGHGQPVEAAMRTCLLATSLAQQMQLGTELPAYSSSGPMMVTRRRAPRCSRSSTASKRQPSRRARATYSAS